MGHIPWFERRRLVWINGKRVLVEPSKRRMERRKAVSDIMNKNHMFHTGKVDEIIDYMQALYDGPEHQGFSRNERRDLFIRRGGACMWCKKPLMIGSFTIEHIKPLVEGGTSEDDNLGIACHGCNNGRDGEVLTSKGYLIEALRKYNPRFAVDNCVDSTANAEVQ